jgi:hypothetical protein
VQRLKRRFTMRFSTGIGQRWKRAIGASSAIVPLSAVAVVGLTLLGSKVISAWKAPENVEQALTSSALDGLLNFEAPEAMVARLAAQKEEFEKDNRRASNASMLVNNWRFTQISFGESLLGQLIEFSILNPGQTLNLRDLIAQSNQVYGLGRILICLDYYIDFINPKLSFLDRLFATYYSLIQAWLVTYNNLVNSLGLEILVKPPLPPLPSPASPYF